MELLHGNLFCKKIIIVQCVFFNLCILEKEKKLYKMVGLQILTRSACVKKRAKLCRIFYSLLKTIVVTYCDYNLSDS